VSPIVFGVPQDDIRPNAPILDITNRLCYDPPDIIGSATPTASVWVTVTVSATPSPGFNDYITDQCTEAFVTGDIARACCGDDSSDEEDGATGVDCNSYFQVRFVTIVNIYWF
jgi:hypothetical protein